jgi:hypothetical protein
LRGTRARRAAFSLVALLFFLESECARAQAPAAPAAAAAQPEWHVIASYGQASAPRSQGFAEAGTLSLARDFPLGSGFVWGVEVTPLFLVNVTRVDLPNRPRESRFAVAAAPFLAFDAFPKSVVSLRLEASVGPLWAFSPVPAEGSRFNFLDILGGRVRVRLSNGVALSGGLRRTHVSNLGTVGPDNPGLSFYAGALALDLAR